jgi:predicted amidohydrolase YtcJ
MCVHAIGDQANHDVLATFEKVLAGRKDAKDLRFRVEHAQVVSEADLPLFAKLGVIASMQPRHATTDMRWAEERVGAARLDGAYAWRTILASGAHVAFGSDFPVEPYAPLLGLYAAVTRQDENGFPPKGWRSEQRLTPEEALKAFTEEPAYAAFGESARGRLVPGQDADLTVLSEDPLELLANDPKKFLETKVLATYVAGVEVFGR